MFQRILFSQSHRAVSYDARLLVFGHGITWMRPFPILLLPSRALRFAPGKQRMDDDARSCKSMLHTLCGVQLSDGSCRPKDQNSAGANLNRD